MRYPAQHKSEIHQKIVKDASHRVRAEGITGAAVSAVMQDAGLTHGGFYKHFGSKDELLIESLSEAFREIVDTWLKLRKEVSTGNSVEGDRKGLPEPGTLRSRRVRVSDGSPCARVGASRQGDEGQNPWGADEIQESNASLYARAANCRQRARFLFDLFNHDRGS